MITKEKIELEIEAEEDLIFYIQQMDTKQIIDALIAYVSGESIQDAEVNLSTASNEDKATPELQIVLEKLNSLEASLKLSQQSRSTPPNETNEDVNDPFCDMFAEFDNVTIPVEDSKPEETDWSIDAMHIC